MKFKLYNYKQNKWKSWDLNTKFMIDSNYIIIIIILSEVKFRLRLHVLQTLPLHSRDMATKIHQNTGLIAIKCVE